MQFHRPSTFGAGVISLPATPQAVPYAGWVAPPSDRTNANRQLQWLDDRMREIHQQAGRLRQKHSQLLSASADRFVLEPLETSLREMETELRTLENDRRNVARKVANMERREKERADKEALAAQAKAYHKLTMKRQSVFGPNSTAAAQKAVASSGTAVQRRTSMFQSMHDTTPAGMEPGGSHAEFMAMAASLSKATNASTNPHTAANPNVDHSDLNWDSSMDQELFLERVAQRVHRDSIFEQQFGHLSEGKGSSSSAGTARKQSVSRRPSALNVPRRSSTIQTSTQHPPPGARHRSTQSRSISFPGHRGPVLIAEESDEDDDDDDDSEMTTDSEASDASDIYTPNSASSHGSASSGHHPHHHRAHSTLSRQASNNSNQGSTSSLASLAENSSNNNPNAPSSANSSSSTATPTSPPFASSGNMRKPSSSRKRMSSEGKSSSYMSSSSAARKSTSAYSSIETSPHSRPTFLAQAADISSSDLSTSLQNYLTHSNAPKGITATEALIDPHLREKISKALQAYIAAATQAALEGHDIVDHDDASSNASSSQASAPSTLPQPSREETLLWGLLMGALRTAEEEQLAIEWWADREKQLYLEVEQRRKRNEAALAARQLSESQRHSSGGGGHIGSPIIGLGGSGGGGFSRLGTMTAPSDYSHSYKPASSSPSLSNSTLMERHAQRGSLLNALSVAQEQLRQLKAAKHLNESALRSLNDAQRQKEFQARHGVLAAAFAANQQQLQKRLAQQNKIKNTAMAAATVGPMGGGAGAGAQNAAVVGSGVSFQFQPNSGIVTVSNSAHIENMCRRFVLGVVNAALVNASTLARQDRTIKDLKWAIAKARRIADLTKNGSINRPASARPKWVSAVSVPTPMPRLSSEGDVTQFLTVEPEGLTRPLSAAVRLVSSDDEEDEKSPSLNNNPTTGSFEFPIREIRAGRGWKDAAYTPHDFDADAARDAQRKGINFVYPPPMISPPKKVQKAQIDPTPFLQQQDGRRSVSPSKWGATASATNGHPGNSLNAIDAELNSFPMDVGRMPDANVVQEDETTRAAVEEWKHMRESRETALATLQAAQALSNAHHHHHHHHHSSLSGANAMVMMRHADPSLLGTPPPLHVSPAVAEDSWGTFVTALENVKSRSKQAAAAAQTALDSSRGPSGTNNNNTSSGSGPKIVLTITGGPSKDPTNKTKPPAPTAAQRYAAAAKGSSNPLVDIPKKCLPRSIYEGCSLANPHPDKQPDACHLIQIRSRTLLAKARRLGLADVEKAMRANTKLFASHFHPGTNSFEWLPIDPLNPARKCVDGCRMHYNVDATGIMTSTSPTRKKPSDATSTAAADEEEKQQQQQPAVDGRPKSARTSSLRRSNSPTVKRQGSTARPSTAQPRSSTEQNTAENLTESAFSHHNNTVHFAASTSSQPNAAIEELSRESAAESASRIFRIEVAKSRPATANPTIGRDTNMSLPPSAASVSRSMTPHPPAAAPMASPRSVSFRNVTVVIPKPE